MIAYRSETFRSIYSRSIDVLLENAKSDEFISLSQKKCQEYQFYLLISCSILKTFSHWERHLQISDTPNSVTVASFSILVFLQKV